MTGGPVARKYYVPKFHLRPTLYIAYIDQLQTNETIVSWDYMSELMNLTKLWIPDYPFDKFIHSTIWRSTQQDPGGPTICRVLNKIKKILVQSNPADKRPKYWKLLSGD